MYIRLIKRRADTIEGKHHVRTVPVKIGKAKKTLRNRHDDANFTFATKRYMQDIASLLGQENVFALSVDDKAKVPIGVTAATKQSPLIIHMTHEIRLPDHDFVKATKHKLTPSVYAACEIHATSSKSDPEISYSGPTYIAIRSGKTDSSAAYTHGPDFDEVLKLEQFKDIVEHDGIIKPIGLVLSDGGPDEKTRFPKILDVNIQHFKNHDFDVLLVSTHTPGMSAYNQVERRMAPLSKALAGVVLPHDTFGNHLDSQRRTTNLELEKQNFRKAGEVLADLWNELILDKFPVFCQYLENSKKEPLPINERWVSKHCRISQYFLQIVKCADIQCCNPFRTNWLKIFPDRFLPAPVPVRQDLGGPIVPSANQSKPSDRFPDLWKRNSINQLIPQNRYKNIPHNMCCPSVKSKVK